MKNLIKNILIPVIMGGIVGLIISPFMNYQNLNKPPLSPPGIVFPIVWTILYIIMGYSFYKQKEQNKAIYYTQLIVNGLWSIIFFIFKWYLLAFIWIILLIILVIIMIYKFYKENKLSGLINISYLIWLFFALYLSFGVYLLNEQNAKINFDISLPHGKLFLLHRNLRLLNRPISDSLLP